MRQTCFLSLFSLRRRKTLRKGKPSGSLKSFPLILWSFTLITSPLSLSHCLSLPLFPPITRGWNWFLAPGFCRTVLEDEEVLSEQSCVILIITDLGLSWRESVLQLAEKYLKLCNFRMPGGRFSSETVWVCWCHLPSYSCMHGCAWVIITLWYHMLLQIDTHAVTQAQNALIKHTAAFLHESSVMFASATKIQAHLTAPPPLPSAPCSSAAP